MGDTNVKTIIAGGRDFVDVEFMRESIEEVLRYGWNVSRVLCGLARGADTLGADWAVDNEVPIDYYPAQWENTGKSAGHIRNAVMANDGEALIAFWDGKSRGTKDMISKALKKGLYIKIFRYKE